MKQISGGVTAPMGFTASGVHCGVKKGKGDGNQPARSGMPEVLADKKDLALIVSEQPCAAAAVYTMNRVKAAPIYVTMDHLENGEAQAIVANSGNANACAPNSHEHAETMCQLAAQATGLQKVAINMRKYWQIYILIIPALIWYIVFAYYPMAGLQLAFKTYKAKIGIWGSPWCGFQNFEAVFRDMYF